MINNYESQFQLNDHGNIKKAGGLGYKNQQLMDMETIDVNNDYPSYNNTLMKEKHLKSTTNKTKDSIF